MRDDDLAFVELVQRDLRDVRWPEPTEIRARARRRSRRTAVVAAVAVLAVVSGSAVALAAHPGAVPTLGDVAVPPPGTARAEIPADALLSEGDLPVRADEQLSESGLGEPVRVDAELATCAKEQGVAVAPVESRYSRSHTLLQSTQPAESVRRARPVLAQDVYRLAPAAPERVFTDLDRYVQACAAWRQTTPTQRDGRAVTVSIQHHWQVVERGFAGERAVLLRHTQSPAGPGNPFNNPVNSEQVRVIMQVGDLVTVLTPDVGLAAYAVDSPPRFDEGELRDLARAAANRLCPAATDPPC